MSYTTEAEVRKELGLDDYHPASATITEFITKSDREVDSLLNDDVKRFVERIYYLGDGRFINLEHPASEIKNLYINGEEFKEYEEDDMLDDGDCEESTNSDPDYWNENEETGDTLTWATDYSYNLYRSLKIAKGGSSESYWYSDPVEEVKEEEVYEAMARIRVDSNSSGHVYLRLQYLDSDDTVIVNHDSAAVSIEVTQPSSASALSVSSSSTSDSTQKLIIEGTVNGADDSEVVSLDGTTSVSSSKSFSYIRGLRLDKACAGTVMVTSNSGSVTNASFSAGDLVKSDWIEAKISGAAPHNVHSARVILRHTGSSGNCWGDSFRLYKRNWKFLPSQKQIEVFDNVEDGSMIKVIYLRTQDPDLVDNLATCLAALRALIWISGGDTDADFQNLKLGGYAPLILKRRHDDLQAKAEFLINQLRQFNFTNPDFEIGKFR